MQYTGGRKLVLLGISVLLALACAEVLVRALHAAPDMAVVRKGRYRLSADPLLGFEPVPERTFGADPDGLYDYAGASNSLGFRDREHALAKTHGTFRVVVLGDSVGAGLKVKRTEDTFPPLLEERLRHAGLHAEVINLSVHGYNTQQEVEILQQRGLAFSPDMVLVAYTLSDNERLDGNIMETLLMQRYGRPLVAEWRLHPWLMSSALWRLLVLRVWQPEQDRALSVAEQREIDQALARISGDTVVPSFARLRALADRHHFAVLVAVFPYFPRKYSHYEFQAEHDLAMQRTRNAGLPAVDLLSTMKRCAQRGRIRMDAFHPNARGHRCAAQTLAAAILAQELGTGAPHQVARVQRR